MLPRALNLLINDGHLVEFQKYLFLSVKTTFLVFSGKSTQETSSPRVLGSSPVTTYVQR